MDHLVDTNVLLHFLEDHPRLSRRMVGWIEDPASRSHVSLASLWEISIKAGLGKLQVSYADREDLPELLERAGFILLPIHWQAIRRAGTLPMHHRDPFDRLIIAEAQLRGLPVLTFDGKFGAYGVETIKS